MHYKENVLCCDVSVKKKTILLLHFYYFIGMNGVLAWLILTNQLGYLMVMNEYGMMLVNCCAGRSRYQMVLFSYITTAKILFCQSNFN